MFGFVSDNAAYMPLDSDNREMADMQRAIQYIYSRKRHPVKTIYGGGHTIYYMHEYVPSRFRQWRTEEQLFITERILDMKGNRGMRAYHDAVAILKYDFLYLVLSVAKSNGIGHVVLVAAPPHKQREHYGMADILDQFADPDPVIDFAAYDIYGIANVIGNMADIERECPVSQSRRGQRTTYQEHMDTISVEGVKMLKEGLFKDRHNLAYFIVDDITTTGNTLNACRQKLIDNGFNPGEVYTMALAKTAR